MARVTKGGPADQVCKRIIDRLSPIEFYEKTILQEGLELNILTASEIYKKKLCI